MTAMGESPDLNDHAAGQLSESDATAPQSDANQLDLFAAGPPEGPALPPAANLVLGRGDRDIDGEPNRADVTGAGLPKQDVPERSLADTGQSDPDELRRLEASIRWLQNESSVRRMPRAATLPPVRGLPPFGAELRADATPRPDPEVRRQDGGNAANQPHALDPDRLLPPRSLRGGTSRGLLKLLIASAVAAPPAYFMANAQSLPNLGSIEAQLAALLPAPKPRRSELTRVPQRVAVAPNTETTAPRAVPEAQDRSAEAVDPRAAEARTAGAAPGPRPAERAAPPRGAEPEDLPPAHELAAASPAGRPQPTTSEPALDAREIALLVERGRAYFAAGDLAAARLLFRRAANGGDAAAALAMGTTYDPAVLANRFVRGMGADLDEARSWYERARELGSPEGPRRLEMLAHKE